jgi:thiamine biosynthesis lipoprotein
MGTVVTLDVRSPARAADLAAAFTDAATLLHQTDELLSTWQPGSWASRLLRCEVTPDGCPAPIPDVVRLAEELGEVTEGYFSQHWRRDPAAGPDATGLVKGWAAQRTSDLLLARGLPDHVVNAAGDLIVSGSPAPGETGEGVRWRVGISDPLNPGGLVGVVELDAGPGRWAVATSGWAERGPHVADPHTGSFPDTVASATAVARVGGAHPEAGAWTDACATALVAAADRSAALLDRLRQRGVHGFLVGDDGSITDPDGLLAV